MASDLTIWRPFHLDSNRLTLGPPLPAGDAVLVDCDVFAERFYGPVFWPDGAVAYKHKGEWKRIPEAQAKMIRPGIVEWLTVTDLRRDIFAAIEAHPAVRFFLPVRGAVRDAVRVVWPSSHDIDWKGDVVNTGLKKFPNVTLLHPVAKQSDFLGIAPFTALEQLASLGVLLSMTEPPQKVFEWIETMFGRLRVPIILHGGDTAHYPALRSQAEAVGVSILEVKEETIQ